MAIACDGSGNITLNEIVTDLNKKQYIVNDKGVLWTEKEYLVGDIMSEDGKIWICTLDHLGLPGDVADGSPTQPNQTNWVQSSGGGVPIVTYNYQSDLLGTSTPPTGPHTYVGDGITNVPDQNGAWYFSVALGSTGKFAVVTIDGFELSPAEFDTSLDGYVRINTNVSNNSTVRITI